MKSNTTNTDIVIPEEVKTAKPRKHSKKTEAPVTPEAPVDLLSEVAKQRLLLKWKDDNERAKTEAEKSLRNALFALYYKDRVTFLKRLQFKKDKTRKFEKEYIAKSLEDGSPVTLKASIVFSIFDLWTDTNDPDNTLRKAQREALEKLRRLASKYPSRQEKSEGREALREASRLFGFEDIGKKINYTEVSDFLSDIFEKTDTWKDNAKPYRKTGLKLQSLLWAIVTEAKPGNLLEEEDLKKATIEEARKLREEASKKTEEASKLLEEARDAKEDASKIKEEALKLREEARKLREEASKKLEEK